jgi:Tfp pilus assembly protein PilF
MIAFLYLADAYLNSKQNELAITNYKKVVSVEPKNATAQYGLGLVYYNQGNKPLAQQQYDLLKPLSAELAQKLLDWINKLK